MRLGRKFANGAVSAAFLRLYNDEKYLLEPEKNEKLKKAFKDADSMREFSGMYGGVRILMKTADPLRGLGHWGLGKIVDSVGQNLLFRLFDTVTAQASKDRVNWGRPWDYGNPAYQYGDPRHYGKPEIQFGDPRQQGPPEIQMGDPRR